MGESRARCQGSTGAPESPRGDCGACGWWGRRGRRTLGAGFGGGFACGLGLAGTREARVRGERRRETWEAASRVEGRLGTADVLYSGERLKATSAQASRATFHFYGSGRSVSSENLAVSSGVFEEGIAAPGCWGVLSPRAGAREPIAGRGGLDPGGTSSFPAPLHPFVYPGERGWQRLICEIFLESRCRPHWLF